MTQDQRTPEGRRGADDAPGGHVGPAGNRSGLLTTFPPGHDDPVPGSSSVELPIDSPAAHEAAQISPAMSEGPFGTVLAPFLYEMCDGRLSTINWFRTDWQRGGALTGYATFKDDRGRKQPVVVKLPVPPCERRWMVALQPYDDITPRVYAHGEQLGGYDMAWLVMERLPHGPLGSAWQGQEFDLVVEAAGRFYQAARDIPLRGQPYRRDWEQILAHSRKVVRQGGIPDPQRWGRALKRAHRKIKKWLRIWHDRPFEDWCHGDLHLGNALTRQPAPEGPAVLIDFARTHVGHWLEDAVYFEHLYWSRRERLKGHRLCKQIAHERKRLGLPVEADWPRLAQIKRLLLALATPVQMRHDGDPAYVRAALEVLEAEVG